jgi:hypothetical protein
MYYTTLIYTPKRPAFQAHSSTFKILFSQTMLAVEPIEEALGLAIAAFFFTAPRLFQPFLNRECQPVRVTLVTISTKIQNNQKSRDTFNFPTPPFEKSAVKN